MGDTFAAWQQEASADETTVRVCLNRRLYREFTDAAADLEAYRVVTVPEQRKAPTTLDEPPPAEVTDEQLEAMLRRVADLEERVREAERPFVFACLPRRRWKELADKHPPTEADKARDKDADVCDDTFWPAATAACCTSPGLTVEEARWLRDGDESGTWPGLPTEKWWEIVAAIRQVNVGGSELPKSVSSIVARLRSGLSSTTAAPEESPYPSSAAGP